MNTLNISRWREFGRQEYSPTENADGILVPVTQVAIEYWIGQGSQLNTTGVMLFPETGYSCDSGFLFERFGERKYCVGPPKSDLGRQLGRPEFCEGNPCNVATGNKFQSERDYTSANAGGLEFTRNYNSFSGRWSNTYDRSISRQVAFSLGVKAIVSATRPDGKVLRFQETTDDRYVAPRGVSDILVAKRDGNLNITGWELRTESDSIEAYGPDGKLRTITGRTGLSQTLTYETVASKSVVKSVTDAFGRLLVFKNDTNGRIQTVTDPAGYVFTYGYDTLGRLATVTFPGLKVRTYHYNEPAMTGGANLPFALTGITDEKNVRYATWKYDPAGNVVLSEHAGGVGRVSLAYLIDSDKARRTQVTDASGLTRTYNLALVNGNFRVTGLDETCDICGDDAQIREYDDNGNLIRRVDRTNVETSWSYDFERNLELTRLDNFSQLTTTEWHTKFRLPTKITVGARETEFKYDPVYGTLLQKTITDATNEISRTWNYTYFDSTRLLKKIDGPRTDLSDETTFNYDAQGNLAMVTNALGHITRYALYDKNGRVGSITDPNGLVTMFTYDEQGRTKTQKRGQEITSFDYDSVGQLVSVTLPSAEVFTYTYDGAHRLIDIKNSAGEHKHFTLDESGNEKKVEHFDALGNATFSNAAEFDRYNRLRRSISSGGQATTFDIDEDGEVRSITDAIMRETRFRREDGLLQEITQPDLSSIQFKYDDLKQLATVTNANSIPVIYTSNALGDMESVATRDPDAFLRMRSVNEAGSLEYKTDFRDKETTFTYDALNRIKTMSAPNAQSVSYGYDNGPNAKGQLTSIIDESGTTTRTFNTQGRIETVTRVFGGISIGVRYDYDTAGRLKTLTYPSGRVVTYKYEKERIIGVDVGAVVLLSQAKYTPFGGARSWRWGSGRDYRRVRDLDGRIERYSFGNSERTIKYDEVGNVREIVDLNDPQQNQKFGYDRLDRITDYFSGPNSVLEEHYEYDLAGNRKSSTIQGKTYSYTYSDATDFLKSVTGPTAKQWQIAPGGLVLSDGKHSFSIDSYRRLGSVTVNNVKIDYLRNGLWQRVTKRSTDGSAVHFVFDESGHLLAELNKSGATLTEHIWLEGQPVGVVANGVTNYIFADHLNTPRLIADTSGRVLWKWHSNPFGGTAANSNPSGLGTFMYGPRFPGQYYDVESGLHYNYFRDYDPQTGRYIQSDPIGLAGGINTYAYVLGNPLSLVDPTGLEPPAGAVAFRDYMGSIWPSPGFANQISGAARDFGRNYNDMRTANTIGADKYFHCKANCEAAQRGWVGKATACVISDAREGVDQYVKMDPASASQADQVANMAGRSGAGSGGACEAVCGAFRPNGLPSGY